MPDALLVAGPVGLSADPDQPQLLAGAGFLAAATAAALSPVQLWARAGSDFGHQQREALTRRRVDAAGVGDEGPTPRLPGAIQGSALPEVEPVDASQLGAVLLIDLAEADLERALGAVASLPDAGSRPVLIAPPADASGEHLRRCAGAAAVLIAGAGQVAAALGEPDPVTCGRHLVDAGATTVLLTHGAFGGLSCYKQKIVSWPSLPRAETGEPGAARAVFAGVIGAEVAHLGRVDYKNLKRWLAMASAVASEGARRASPKHLMGMSRGDCQDLFLRLRRNAKY